MSSRSSSEATEVTEAPTLPDRLTIVPANEASWDDIAAIFGTADYPSRCQCQRSKVIGWIWRDSTLPERTEMLRAQTACGDPKAAETSGRVAYLDGEPAGWVAVEPRIAYPKLRTTPASPRSATRRCGGSSCGSPSTRTATRMTGRDLG